MSLFLQLGGELFRSTVEWIRQPGLDVVVAIVLFVAGWYLSALLARLLRGRVRRRFRRPSVAALALRGIRAAVLIGVTLVVLGLFGVSAGDLLFSVTVISAVVGVVLAPLAQNAVSGMLVLLNRPYEVGDMIELVGDGEENRRGYVDDITLQYTRMITIDNTFILVPNETIQGRDVINYSAEDERTRVSVELTVTYEGDLEEARRLAEDAVGEIEGVIDGGPEIRIGTSRYPVGPDTFVSSFGDHGIVLDLRFWVRKPYPPIAMRSWVHEELWTAFSESEVEIPYSHTHLVFDETSGEARVALERERALAGTGAGGRVGSAAD
jgi:small conductance mechanosensitive channel